MNRCSVSLQFSLCNAGMIWLLACGVAAAQIVPDSTLPTNSSVPRNCTNCEISGGTRAGNNLFHSFRQFSVPTGGRAYFNNSTDIRNIFARVTGQSRSFIDGVIQANGAANVFLLNPNGILFGRNASLNLGGSFFATTADRINFADGVRFSATSPEASPVLTINIPVGLQFGRNPGSIVNRSQAAPDEAVNLLGAPAGLQVQAGRTLGLIGSGVTLNGGNLTASSGRIELGSVAPFSQVDLTSNGMGYTPVYTGRNFSDIQVANLSYIDTSSPAGQGGSLHLQGRTIRLSGNSSIVSATNSGTGGTQRFTATEGLILDPASVGTFAQGTGKAGDITIHSDSLELLTDKAPRPVGTPSLARSFLSSQASSGSSGDAGNITIRTKRLSIQDGSRVEASTFGTGDGGTIAVRAATIEVNGFYPQPLRDPMGRLRLRGQVTSGISSQAERNAGINAGDAGSITIQTGQLNLLNGGLVSTATFGGGDGGDLTIRAADIHLSGVSPAVTRSQYRSGIFVSAEPTASGRVGELNVTSNRLHLEDRAEISAKNRGSGQPGAGRLNLGALDVEGGSEISASTERSGRGGTLIINAGSIQLSGAGEFPGRSSSEAPTEVPSSLSALSTASASGRAGDLQIHTSRLTVQDGAAVSVSGEGRGAAGNLTVDAKQILLNRGSLEAATQAGQGAKISLDNADLVLMQNQSAISAEALNNATGGNVDLQAPDGFLVAGANQNNDIVATADAGRGGNIIVNTRGLIGLEERLSRPANLTNDIDASSKNPATQGTVTITQPNLDPSQGLVELPSTLIDASNLIARTCPTGGTVASVNRLSEFVITGRGGLPPSPSDNRDDETLTGWAELEPAQTTGEEANRETPAVQSSESSGTIVEAQGWQRDAQGAVWLVGQTSAVTPAPDLMPKGCDPEAEP